MVVIVWNSVKIQKGISSTPAQTFHKWNQAWLLCDMLTATKLVAGCCEVVLKQKKCDPDRNAATSQSMCALCSL